MKRIVGLLLLVAMPMVLAACCDCEKKPLETWGPGLVHWGDQASTQPAGK